MYWMYCVICVVLIVGVDLLSRFLVGYFSKSWGKIVIVKAGDGIYMEPDIIHGAVCLEAGILIDTFSPMRADFLK